MLSRQTIILGGLIGLFILGGGKNLPPPSSPVPLVSTPTKRQVQYYYNLFDSSMLISCLVGRAEGTKDLSCQKNSAWYGHTDPGDGLWNRGWCSFSLTRHGMKVGDTPEEADKQCRILIAKRAKILQEQFDKLRIKTHPLATINALDLAIQSPQAAFGDECNPGYARNLNDYIYDNPKAPLLTQIIEARVKSYWSNCSGKYEVWCKSYECIKADQERRVYAILSAYKQIK